MDVRIRAKRGMHIASVKDRCCDFEDAPAAAPATLPAKKASGLT
jgi:hypothetical protein